jgi:glycogen operon protein
MRLQIGAGQPHPLGLTETCNGFNFTVFSRHASSVFLLIFDEVKSAPIATIALDRLRNRTGDIWHAALSADV